MPSGAKRRKAAKKKKEKVAISNGDGEVKVIESDSGENSSPASQDLEPQQNPFGKDEEDQDLSPANESMESKNDGSRDVGEAKSDNGGKACFDCSGLEGPPNGTLKSGHGDDDESQFAEKNIVELNLVEKSVGSGPAESKSKKIQEKVVHPSESFSDFKQTSAESLPLFTANSGGPSVEIVGNQWPQSINNGHWHAGSSDVQPSTEKEPLLLVPRPVPKTSWTGCCGLFELFTG